MRVELLAIDCQNDFCDPGGALYVPGAENDMSQLGDVYRSDRGSTTQYALHA